MRESMDLNRARWDELVPIHARSSFYGVKKLLAGGLTLNAIELDEVGSVEGKSLLHLQCHFGLDTLSWARLGATVTGVDYSGAAIEQARELSTKSGIDGTFIQSNVYDLPDVLDDSFDLVFTSYGVLGWLPDINGWAEIVARYLKPGGTFYIVEGHPFIWGFETTADGQGIELKYPYFGGDEPQVFDEPGTYADESAEIKNTVTHEWSHPIGEVVTALITAGLQIEFLHEHPIIPWKPFAIVEQVDDDYYKLPDGFPSLPLLFSLKATRK